VLAAAALIYGIIVATVLEWVLSALELTWRAWRKTIEQARE